MSHIEKQTNRKGQWKTILIWCFIGIVCAGFFEICRKQIFQKWDKKTIVNKTLQSNSVKQKSPNPLMKIKPESEKKTSPKNKKESTKETPSTSSDVINRLGNIANLAMLDDFDGDIKTPNLSNETSEESKNAGDEVLERQLKVIDDLLEE